MSWMEQIHNPKGFFVKKYLFEILKEKSIDHEDIAQRIGQSLVTEEDLSKFAALLAAVFETGYLRAVANHKEELAKLGLKAKIVHSNNG